MENNQFKYEILSTINLYRHVKKENNMNFILINFDGILHIFDSDRSLVKKLKYYL